MNEIQALSNTEPYKSSALPELVAFFRELDKGDELLQRFLLRFAGTRMVLPTHEMLRQMRDELGAVGKLTRDRSIGQIAIQIETVPWKRLAAVYRSATGQPLAVHVDGSKVDAATEFAKLYPKVPHLSWVDIVGMSEAEAHLFLVKSGGANGEAKKPAKAVRKSKP